ncbi:MAG: hypothetical protein JRJ23_03780 [Deltaproteobacteria bacterium]|nr:hypothetical protein [Deltaproteobacteria bacterium]
MKSLIRELGIEVDKGISPSKLILGVTEDNLFSHSNISIHSSIIIASNPLVIT